MFSLTPRERKVLIFIACLILCGAVLRFLDVNLSRQKALKEIEPAPSAFTGTNISTQRTVVNVNNASQEELEKLPGIGSGIARRIIQYRQSKSRFTTFDDLKKVKGIGDKKLASIKQYICF